MSNSYTYLTICLYPYMTHFVSVKFWRWWENQTILAFFFLALIILYVTLHSHNFQSKVSIQGYMSFVTAKFVSRVDVRM